MCSCLLWLVLINPLLDLVLEAALGYAGAIGTLLMDELASLNERCDSSVINVKMEDCQATLPELPMRMRDSLSPTSPTSYCR